MYTADKRFDPVHYDKIAAAFKAGSSIIPGAGGKFAAPSMEAAASKQAIIKSMREDFYTTFFQSYGDRAAQKTATESAQDFAQTTQAFLSMLATSINEAENEIMWRVEQAYEPARPNLWGSAHVGWTKNFASVQDPNERINSLVDRTMPGGKVPASFKTMRSSRYGVL